MADTPITSWKTTARRIVEELRKPTPEERALLLDIVQVPRPGTNPDAGRRDAALALQPVLQDLDPDAQVAVALLLHDWSAVLQVLRKAPETRAGLFHALVHEEPSVRRWLARQMDAGFCQNDAERMLLDLARGRFASLQDWARDEEVRELLVAALTDVAASPLWGAFQRDQAARLLRRLGKGVDAIKRPRRARRSPSGPLLRPPPEPDLEQPALQALLDSLQTRGLRTRDGVIHPDIQIGTVTGRVTYRNPAVQTWSKQERAERLLPSPGRVFLVLDYGQIEPVILLNVLVQRLWLPLSLVPRGDVYLWFWPEDRSTAKMVVNKIINGGTPVIADPRPDVLRFVRAVEMFRREWAKECLERSFVPTLFGRPMPLPEEPNLYGKMVNRLVQGTAADIFNRAVVEIHRRTQQEALPADVVLLVYDEVWVEADENRLEEVKGVCQTILEEAARRVCLYLAPTVRVEQKGGEQS